MNSTENEAGSMTEVTVETNILSLTSQVDPLNTSENRGSSRNFSGDGSTILQNIDQNLPDNSPFIINLSGDKQQRKKAVRQARKEKNKLDLENKKRIIVETPSDDKENEMVPLGKLLAERKQWGRGRCCVCWKNKQQRSSREE